MPNETTLQHSNDIKIKLSTPGKVILHGEHSVVYGRVAIAASLGLRTKLCLEETPHSLNKKKTFALELKAFNYKNVYDLSDIQKNLLETNAKYSSGGASAFSFEHPDEVNHEAVLKLVEDFVANSSDAATLDQFKTLSLTSLFYLLTGILCSVNFTPNSLSLVIETELNVSAGTGSSASYLVSIAAALVQYVRLNASRLQIRENISKPQFKPANIEGASSRSFSNRELEIVSKWAQNAERIIHGRVSGIDNTICTYGSMVEFKKGTAPKMVKISSNFTLLLINSKVPRNTKTLVAKVAALKEKYPDVVDSLLDALNSIAERAVGIFSSGSSEESRDKDLFGEIEELFELNHSILRSLGVSHFSLEDICQRVQQYGLHAKLTGAGGGGYAIAIVPPYADKASVQELCQSLQSCGYEAVLTELGGPGVVIES